MIRIGDIQDNLVKQYEGYFDIEQPHTYGNRVIPVYARYVQRIEKYVLVKSDKLNAKEAYEHVFFVHTPNLNRATWEAEKIFITEAEKDYVVPHAEHMYSYITLILLCERISEDVKKQIRGFRFTRNYKLSMHGCSTVRVAALDASNASITTNKRGKEIKKVMEKALHM